MRDGFFDDLEEKVGEFFAIAAAGIAGVFVMAAVAVVGVIAAVVTIAFWIAVAVAVIWFVQFVWFELLEHRGFILLLLLS